MYAQGTSMNLDNGRTSKHRPTIPSSIFCLLACVAFICSLQIDRSACSTAKYVLKCYCWLGLGCLFFKFAKGSRVHDLVQAVLRYLLPWAVVHFLKIKSSLHKACSWSFCLRIAFQIFSLRQGRTPHCMCVCSSLPNALVKTMRGVVRYQERVKKWLALNMHLRGI